MAIIDNGYGFINVGSSGPPTTGGGMPGVYPQYGIPNQNNNGYNSGFVDGYAIPINQGNINGGNFGFGPINPNQMSVGFNSPSNGQEFIISNNQGNLQAPPNNIRINPPPFVPVGPYPGNGQLPDIQTSPIVVTQTGTSNSSTTTNNNSARYGSSGTGPVNVGGGTPVNSNTLGPFPNTGGGSKTPPPPPPDDIDPKDPKYIPSGTRIYTKFDTNNDIIDKIKEVRTKGLWSENEGSLTTFFTSSLQTSGQKSYYYEVYQSESLSCNSQPQFSVIYGHKYGSGSYSGGGQLNDSPSKAMYSQYKLLCLEQNESTFTFKNSVTSNHIYAININRNRLEDKIDPGNFQIALAQLTGSSNNNSNTGSNVRVATGSNVYTLIDDSGDADQSVTHLGSFGRVYNLVSGSINDGVYSNDNNSWGLVYPDLGILVLNADVLNASCSFNTVTGSNINGDNAYKLFTAISGAAAPTLTRSTIYSMDARNSETVMSTHYFVRVKNSEYNFSNNPTYVSGTLGEFSQPTFVGDPKVYMTSIGLYNDRNELLAVAKLSKPIKKTFTEESLITVKLEY